VDVKGAGGSIALGGEDVLDEPGAGEGGAWPAGEGGVACGLRVRAQVEQIGSLREERMAMTLEASMAPSGMRAVSST
jgi:hypothetical protein